MKDDDILYVIFCTFFACLAGLLFFTILLLIAAGLGWA
jgi:hypothetical protein